MVHDIKYGVYRTSIGYTVYGIQYVDTRILHSGSKAEDRDSESSFREIQAWRFNASSWPDTT